MKNFTIPQPCNENFAAMTPTEQGAYCTKCATNTFDFRNKNTEEIKQVLRAHVGKHICGQITKEQEDKLNAEFEAWSFRSTRSFQSAFLFTLIATFGLTLFSCNEKKHEAEIVQLQETAKSILANGAAFEEKLVPVEEVKMVQTYLEAPVALIDFTWPTPEVQQMREYQLGEIQVNDERYYGYGGAMAYTTIYTDYLIATVDPVEEFDTEGRLIPTAFSSMAFPNPTAASSTIEIKAPSTGEFQIDLYDMSGKHQSVVYSGTIERGTFQQNIEMSDLPPGMYLVTILSKEYKETVRVSKI